MLRWIVNVYFYLVMKDCTYILGQTGGAVENWSRALFLILLQFVMNLGRTTHEHIIRYKHFRLKQSLDFLPLYM